MLPFRHRIHVVWFKISALRATARHLEIAHLTHNTLLPLPCFALLSLVASDWQLIDWLNEHISRSKNSSPWSQSKRNSNSSTTIYIIYTRKKRIQRQQTSRKRQRKTKTLTKTMSKTCNAWDTQYSIGHAPKSIRVRATVANQLWRANQYKLACFGLPSPWSFPLRSDILLHAVVLPCLSLPRSISS